MAGEAVTSGTTTTPAANAGPATPDTLPTRKEASKLIAGLSDSAIDEHLAKDARGEFSKPPKQEPEKTHEAGKGRSPDTPDTADTKPDKRDERIAQQQRFIGQQGTELRTLREQVSKLSAELNQLKAAPGKEDGASDFFADPEGSVKKLLTKAEQEKADREATANKARTETYQTVATVYPNIQELLPEMLRIAQADGVPDDALDTFARDPFGEHPHALMSLAHRAKLEIEMRELRKPAAPKQPEHAPKIPSPGITGAMGRSGSPVGTGMISRQQLANMSDAELAELMHKGG